MEAIKHLQINNYKSINRIDLDCSRINVFIGEPNSGKSNILEALNLTYLSKLMGANQIYKKAKEDEIKIQDLFRATSVKDLFHHGNIDKQISINAYGLTVDSYSIRFDSQNDKNIFEWSNTNGSITEFDNNFIPIETANNYSCPIKPYSFKDNIKPHDVGNFINTLMPPFGNNLYNVIQHNKSFQRTIEDLVEDYGFEINIDTTNNQILIQQRINKGLVYSVPYIAIADTFKRLIFHVAAVRYSNASIITLDEPDAYSFPKYVSFLADEIIETINKQYFIATHSPYLLNNFIENTPHNDLAVFVCAWNKNKSETIIKKLSQEDLSELIDYGVDIFFNLNRYLDDRIEYNS